MIGGDNPPYNKNNFYFNSFSNARDEIVSSYELLLKNSSIEELSLWFGLKNLKECKKYSKSILYKPTMKAIRRYTGVAFDALEYNNLSKEEQYYCDENVILFSNLFGVLKASDLIPDYKFKQGAILPNIDVITKYKENIKSSLDEYLEDEVIDLRAGFYDKFYKPSAPTITFKFLKNNKVVSHWAKHYRGLLVKSLAKNNITNFAQLMLLEIEELKLIEIQERKNIKTLIMEII
jgi:cytoplasmic iron level regulating protein YaaA (DUF328/UPF0246 family)